MPNQTSHRIRRSLAVATAAAVMAGGALLAPRGSHAAPPAALCSVYPSTEFSAERTRGIVHQAQVVVRARANGAVPAPPGARANGYSMSFTVLDVLKGTPPSETLVFMGVPDDRDSFREGEDAQVPYLSYYRRYAGDCIAAWYRPGAEYLLLLAPGRDGGALDPYWKILAPTNEQIRGPEDPWVVWVRTTLAESTAGS